MVKKQTKTANRRVVRRGNANDAVIARRVIIGVICVAIVAVMAGLVGSFFWDGESMTKKRIEEMAKEYYEEFIYENLAEGTTSQSEIEKKMDRYAEWGYAPVSLRQLLMYDAENNKGEGSFVKKYCDENSTSVKIYPEAPYDVKSYRIDYKYDCEW